MSKDDIFYRLSPEDFQKAAELRKRQIAIEQEWQAIDQELRQLAAGRGGAAVPSAAMPAGGPTTPSIFAEPRRERAASFVDLNGRSFNSVLGDLARGKFRGEPFTLDQLTEAMVKGWKFPEENPRIIRKWLQLRLSIAKGEVVEKVPNLVGTWVAIEAPPQKRRPGRPSLQEVEEVRRQSLLKLKKAHPASKK